MPDSILEKDTVRPVFKPPFDIIWNIAEDARKVGRGGAALTEPECLSLLPRLDELRTYCYENDIEEIPERLAS